MANVGDRGLPKVGGVPIVEALHIDGELATEHAAEVRRVRPLAHPRTSTLAPADVEPHPRRRPSARALSCDTPSQGGVEESDRLAELPTAFTWVHN